MRVLQTTTLAKSVQKLIQPLLILVILNVAISVSGQTTSFTYQGALSDGGTMANGNYDLKFSLWDSSSGGTQIGATQSLNVVSVSNGIFSVTLDFGANAFSGPSRFLELSTRPAGAGEFTLLSPRQQITSTPFAIRSLNAGFAEGLSPACSGCVNDGNISSLGGNKINGAIPVASVPAGSANYIQNSSAQQSNSDFNVSGTGTANSFNAATQYNIGGARVLSNPGIQNLFAGTNAGAANSSGQGNSFFGSSAGSMSTGSFNSFFGGAAGKSTTTGDGNSFFGYAAGTNNTTGGSNAFYGPFTGFLNTTGNSNSFFGTTAGTANTTGSSNSFYGSDAGKSNVDANNNAFFGASAGTMNTASRNSFFGTNAGRANTTASDNSFFGNSAGSSNTTGSNNTFVGGLAGTANKTGEKNSMFGLQAGRNNTTGSENSFFGFYSGVANTEGSYNNFFGNFSGASNTTGMNNSFFGYAAGLDNITGTLNAFFGGGAGRNSTTGTGDSFFGIDAGHTNVVGYFNTTIGYNADVGSGNLLYATAIGANARVDQNSSLVLGGISGVNGATTDTNVGIGTTSPNERLTIKTPTGKYGFIHTDGAITVGSFVGGSGNGGYIGTKSNHPLHLFVNNGGPSLTVQTGGNVGIGTTAPKTKLDVRGGNIFIANPNSLIITSPNSACWQITVNNAGILSTISVACP